MATAFKSAERVEDSSEDESSTSTPTQSLKQQVNSIQSISSSTKEKVGSRSDTSDAESDTSSNSAKSASSSTSSKSSSSVASSASKRKAKQPPANAASASAKKAKITSADRNSLQNVKRIEAKMFVPPQGYTAAASSASDFSSKTSGIFDELEGKQVWYISAPSTMPITRLESVDVSAALKGAPVLEHNGVTYNMTQADETSTTLLLPKGARGDYATSNTKITRNLQIRETTRPIRDVAATEANAADNVAPAASISFFAQQSGMKKPPRKQPDNLRTRWTAFGAQDAHVDAKGTHQAASDLVLGDMDVVPATPLISNGDDVEQTPKSKKKKKKEKHIDHDQDVEMADVTPRSAKTSKHVDAGKDLSPVPEKKKKRRKEKAVEA